MEARHALTVGRPPLQATTKRGRTSPLSCPDSALPCGPSGTIDQLDIEHVDMEDKTDIPRTVVRQGAWSRAHFVGLSIILGVFGAPWTMAWIWLWARGANPEFHPTDLVGPIILLIATAMLWKALKLRPRSILFEIDESGIVLHVSPRMRKLERPVVLSWTDIAVIRTRTSGNNEDLFVQSRDGVWHQLPVLLSSPCRLVVIEAMLAALKKRGIHAERKYTFMAIVSRTEWTLGPP